MSTAYNLMLWSEEPPVKDSASQASAKDWTMTALTSASHLYDWFIRSAQDGSYGKMSQEYLPQEKAKTLGVFCPDSQEWMFPFRTKGGRTQEWLSERKDHIPSPGECWMLNTPEYHSAAVASSLSDILETGDVPQRYFLSQKACKGILRRAAKRGKTLPVQLATALMKSATQPEMGSDLYSEEGKEGQDKPLLPLGVEVGPSGGRFTEVCPTLDARCKDGFIRNQLSAGVYCAEVAPTLNVHFGSKQGLEDQHINGEEVSLCLTSHYAKGGDPQVDQLIVGRN